MAHLLKFTCIRNFVPRSCPPLCYPRFMSSERNYEPAKNNNDEVSIPDGPHQIYKGLLTTQVRMIKTFTLGTSFMGISMQPILYEQFVTSGTNWSLLLAASSVVGFFTFLTPFLIHYVTKKYITEIIYDPSKEEYTAMVYNILPTTQKQIHFKLDDIKVPDVPGAFTTLYAKDVPLFCIPDDFTYPEHYGKFMGFDKPMDFKLGDQKKEEN